MSCSASERVCCFDSLRDFMREFVRERAWDQFHTPVNVLLAMMGEVGELSEIFQWRGFLSDMSKFTEEEICHLGEEISDVFIYNTRLADLCGIDLSHAVHYRIVEGKKDECGKSQTRDALPASRIDVPSNESLRISLSFVECKHVIPNPKPLASGDESTLSKIPPRHIVLSVGATAGSLCQLVLRKSERQCAQGLPSWCNEDCNNLAYGLADLACSLIALADLANLDIGQCIRSKLEKNSAKYPVHLVHGSSAKYTAYTHIIKKQKTDT